MSAASALGCRSPHTAGDRRGDERRQSRRRTRWLGRRVVADQLHRHCLPRLSGERTAPGAVDGVGPGRAVGFPPI